MGLGKALYKIPKSQMTPPLIKPLQERGESTEEGGDTNNGDVGTVEVGSTGGGAGGAAAGGGTGGTGGAVGGGGVVVGGITLEVTLDDVVGLELLEVGAREVTVGGLHVEGTLNILQSTERDPVERY